LDFYALDANSQKVEKGVNGSYTDLLLGTSRFVLDVSIDDADAQKYNGQTVYLAGNFETIAAGAAENGWAIRWDQSKTNGAINYYGQNNNGSGLQFQINGNKTYLIEWVFKTGGNYNGGEIGFDYKISTHANSPTKYNLSGDAQATIAFTNENDYASGTGRTEVLLNSQHTFTKNGDSWTSRSFNGSFPIGTKITLNFSKGGGIKLCDNSNRNLYVPAILGTLQQGSYSTDMGNLWMNVPNGDLVLEITNDIALYNKGNNPGNPVYLSANNPLNGLVIESGETVLERVTVTYPQ
jgi:hypothetical protein